MNCPTRDGWPEPRRREPSRGDAHAVEQNGHRNRGESDRPAAQRRRLRESSDQSGDAHQRHDRPNSTARVVDFERDGRERQDVSVTQYRHIGEAEQMLAKLRRYQLQRDGNPVEHDGRQRNHEDQKCQRKSDDA